jgi:hypothetical protein
MMRGAPESVLDSRARGAAKRIGLIARKSNPVRFGPHSVGWPRQELFAWCEQRLIEQGDTWQSLGDAAARVVEKTREKAK